MPLPKLSPLQSRLAASLTASVIILLLYLALFSGHFAYALDVDSIRAEDHNHERLLGPFTKQADIENDEWPEITTGSPMGMEVPVLRDMEYESEFLGFDRSIIGRAEPVPLDLKNNVGEKINVNPGQTVYRKVLNATIWGSLTPVVNNFPSSLGRRQPDNRQIDHVIELRDLNDDEGIMQPRQLPVRTLYITLNTCLQPSTPNDPTGSQGLPAQVELYVSQTEQNPGPDKSPNKQQKQVADGGFASIALPASGDVYIGLFAPNTTTGTSLYSVELGASIDAPYHDVNTTGPFLFFIDSDADSVLLATSSLTDDSNGTLFDQWMQIAPPFDVLANNDSNPLLAGVRNSFCGLQMISQIADPSMVQTSITDKTFGSNPKQQFFFKGLATNSRYSGTLAFNNHSMNSRPGVVGGGGKVWQMMEFETQAFSTQSSVNCELIFNLTFCDSVAYAVPSNPNTFSSTTALASFYDGMAQTLYQNFQNALQQIPCEASSTGQYSLARNCTDCASAYKNWLCSVTIPRCMPYSSNSTWLQRRNIAQPFPDNTSLPADVLATDRNVLFLNSSRNPTIDQMVQPGPYKEILPCNDLCYNLVQSCPAQMGFACPVPGQMGFDSSYGLRPSTPEQSGLLTCNYPGAAYALSQGAGYGAPCGLILLTLTFLGFVLA